MELIWWGSKSPKYNLAFWAILSTSIFLEVAGMRVNYGRGEVKAVENLVSNHFESPHILEECPEGKLKNIHEHSGPEKREDRRDSKIGAINFEDLMEMFELLSAKNSKESEIKAEAFNKKFSGVSEEQKLLHNNLDSEDEKSVNMFSFGFFNDLLKSYDNLIKHPEVPKKLDRGDIAPLDVDALILDTFKFFEDYREIKQTVQNISTISKSILKSLSESSGNSKIMRRYENRRKLVIEILSFMLDLYRPNFISEIFKKEDVLHLLANLDSLVPENWTILLHQYIMYAVDTMSAPGLEKPENMIMNKYDEVFKFFPPFKSHPQAEAKISQKHNPREYKEMFISKFNLLSNSLAEKQKQTQIFKAVQAQAVDLE
ncbi:expressed protein [Phakopsora pachyrhizi]|uniref:Expressed protein n=1 Tax=Phakopsora pachyrhizi TaxID=170000 RepID=A0AAV0BWY7_PHAPC|nr:expressed protein [Phakopsora pachyrhizi]